MIVDFHAHPGYARELDELLFSTCWPLFYARSAALKMEEAELSPEQFESVRGGNAVRAFGLSAPGA